MIKLKLTLRFFNVFWVIIRDSSQFLDKEWAAEQYTSFTIQALHITYGDQEENTAWVENIEIKLYIHTACRDKQHLKEYTTNL